jgi:hypothetical protein
VGHRFERLAGRRQRLYGIRGFWFDALLILVKSIELGSDADSTQLAGAEGLLARRLFGEVTGDEFVL